MVNSFERHKNLTESILYAANNWKVDTGWTNHLEQINIVCKQNEEMLEMLQQAYNYLDGKPEDWHMKEQIKQLITEATTLP